MFDGKKRAVLFVLGLVDREFSGMELKTACRISAGEIYPILSMLEDDDKITSRKLTVKDTKGITPRGGIFPRAYKIVKES